MSKPLIIKNERNSHVVRKKIAFGFLIFSLTLTISMHYKISPFTLTELRIEQKKNWAALDRCETPAGMKFWGSWIHCHPLIIYFLPEDVLLFIIRNFSVGSLLTFGAISKQATSLMNRNLFSFGENTNQKTATFSRIWEIIRITKTMKIFLTA